MLFLLIITVLSRPNDLFVTENILQLFLQMDEHCHDCLKNSDDIIAM